MGFLIFLKLNMKLQDIFRIAAKYFFSASAKFLFANDVSPNSINALSEFVL